MCKSEKNLSEFYKSKKCLQGVFPQCISCLSEDRKVKRTLRTQQQRIYDTEKSLLWYKNNKETAKQRMHEWRKSNKHLCRQAEKQWKQANKGKVNASVAKRAAQKKSAYASWCSEFTDFVSLEAADLCIKRKSATGFSWHVDHIIPISGKKVCGLHVWNNIAVIPAVENLRKNNKFLIEIS